MSIVEYLYVDERRLDAYIDQIGPPVTYDKVPEWKVQMSLAGPRAEARQVRSGRPLTQHEKIEKLSDHLVEHGLLLHNCGVHDRGLFPWPMRTEFILTKVVARRIFVPPKTGDGVEYPGITMWISDWSERGLQGMLFLLEDYRRDDGRAMEGGTAYSLLLSILFQLQKELQQTIIGESFRIPASRTVSARTEQAIRAFTANPYRTLEKMGCQVGGKRGIRSLYRIREYHETEIFGYPIFIAEDR